MKLSERINNINEEWLTWIIIPAILVLIGTAGVVWRVTHNQAAFPKESSAERSSRLMRCLEVSGTTPTNQQILSGDEAGVCSGFSNQQIQNAKKNLENNY